MRVIGSTSSLDRFPGRAGGRVSRGATALRRRTRPRPRSSCPARECQTVIAVPARLATPGRPVRRFPARSAVFASPVRRSLETSLRTSGDPRVASAGPLADSRWPSPGSYIRAWSAGGRRGKPGGRKLARRRVVRFRRAFGAPIGVSAAWPSRCRARARAEAAAISCRSISRGSLWSVARGRETARAGGRRLASSSA